MATGDLIETCPHCGVTYYIYNGHDCHMYAYKDYGHKYYFCKTPVFYPYAPWPYSYLGDNKKQDVELGWMCPCCKMVYAPSVKQCDCRVGK